MGTFAELALDAFSVAAFLVSSASRVLMTNGAGERLIDNSEALLRVRGELSVRDPREQARFAALVRSACGKREQGDRDSSGGALHVSRSDRVPLQVCVLPVPPDHATALRVPCAIVIVNDPANPPKSRTNVLRDLYSLTPTETRMANLLLQGHDVNTIATEMLISIGTARFHLKRVLAKTGTKRQSELIRLMLRLPGQDGG